MRTCWTERWLIQIFGWRWKSLFPLALTHPSWCQVLSIVTVCYHSKIRSGSPSAKLASIVKEDRLTLLFPLMFSHPVNLEIRCAAPREAGRGRSVPVGPRTRPVGPQLLSAAVAGGSWGTSPAQGRCLAAEKAVPTRPAKKAGTPALRSAGRGGPPPPSAGYPQRLPRRRQLSLQQLAAATTASRPGTRRSLML